MKSVVSLKWLAVMIVLALLISLASPSAPASAQTAVSVPSGFGVSVFASGLSQPTSLAFGPDGALYVATYGDGSIHAVAAQSNGGTSDRVVVSGLRQPLGIAFNNNLLYVSTRGEISTVSGWDGKSGPASRRVIISGLPNGRHQNDGIAFGPDGKMYVGNGSTSDLGAQASPMSAAVLRANPDGSGLEVYAGGLRNPYGLAFNRSGDLFATDNGPDAIPAPDELNQIVQGGNYGFPNDFGSPPAGSSTIGPVAAFADHSAATGITFYTGSQFPAEYQDNAFVTLWGATFGPVPAGHKMVRVQLQRSGNTYTSQVSDFAAGLTNPIDVKMGPDGELYVADYGTGTIYRIFYTSDVVVFPETGKHLGFGFKTFWENNGGLRIFGFPITDERQENGMTVQYFERARFEYHPELAGTPFAVQLGLLGQQLTAGRRGEPPFQPVSAFPDSPNRRYFPGTGHSLAFGFKAYWENNGSLPVFGYPISEEFQENGLTVQYFERARFEFHPDLVGTPFSVQLGLLGEEALAAR